MAAPARRVGSLPAVSEDRLAHMRLEAPHHVNPPPPDIEPDLHTPGIHVGDVNVATVAAGASVSCPCNLWGNSEAALHRLENVILPGEAFGQPRHLYMGDPTFIFNEGSQAPAFGEPYITVTLTEPVALSALAITTTPWDRSMDSCVFQVRKSSAAPWVDVATPSSALQAPWMNSTYARLNSAYRGLNVASTTSIALPPKLAATRWAECRFGGRRAQKTRVLAVWAYRSVLESPCVWGAEEERPEQVRRGTLVLLMHLRRILTAYDSRRVIELLAGKDAVVAAEEGAATTTTAGSVTLPGVSSHGEAEEGEESKENDEEGEESSASEASPAFAFGSQAPKGKFAFSFG